MSDTNVYPDKSFTVAGPGAANILSKLRFYLEQEEA